MSIFSRIGEIINANINAMLDKAEDPVRMIRLMIHEMEDTLMEIKSSAAEIIADQIRLQKQIKADLAKANDWEKKAALALEKEREDLAKEALEQKIRCEQLAEAKQERLEQVNEVAEHYRKDINRLEAKLNNAIKKYKALEDEQRHAENRKKVENGIHRLNTESTSRFETMERKVDLLQAENQLHAQSLEARFEELEAESRIESELDKLKKNRKKREN